MVSQRVSPGAGLTRIVRTAVLESQGDNTHRPTSHYERTFPPIPTTQAACRYKCLGLRLSSHHCHFESEETDVSGRKCQQYLGYPSQHNLHRRAHCLLRGSDCESLQRNSAHKDRYRFG